MQVAVAAAPLFEAYLAEPECRNSWMRKGKEHVERAPESSVSTETLSHSRHSPSPTPLMGHHSAASSVSPSASRDRQMDCTAGSGGADPTGPAAGSGRDAISSGVTDVDAEEQTAPENNPFAMRELVAPIPYTRSTDILLDPNVPDGELPAPAPNAYRQLNSQSPQQHHQNQQRQQNQQQRDRGSRSSEDEDGSSCGCGAAPIVILNPRISTGNERNMENSGGLGSDREPDNVTSSKQLRIAHSPNTFRSYSNL